MSVQTEATPTAPTETAVTTWEIWAQTPDGAVGPATFCGKAEVSTTLEAAEHAADRYASEQVGWKKPVAERWRYFIVEVTTCTRTERSGDLAMVDGAETTETMSATITRRFVREGVSWNEEEASAS